MRYPVKFVAPDEVFGPDVKVGVRLLDEPVIAIPDECPPAVCAPSFSHWIVSVWLNNLDDNTFGFTVLHFACGEDPTVPVGPVFDAGVADYSNSIIVITFIPMLERCGHVTRIIPSDMPGAEQFATAELLGLDDRSVEGYSLNIFGPSGDGGQLQTQIDLTDAEVGFETWTDIGCPLAVFGPTS